MGLVDGVSTCWCCGLETLPGFLFLAVMPASFWASIASSFLECQTSSFPQAMRSVKILVTLVLLSDEGVRSALFPLSAC